MVRKISILLTVIVAIVLFNNYNLPRSEESVHYHAGFRVYIDGALQDYSDYKYMHFAPCSEHEETRSLAEEQMEKAHLHDGVGDVVHVHRADAVWRDLFTNIQVELPKDKTFKGFINGIENDDILDAPVKGYNTAIFVVGSSDASHDTELVSIDYIKEMEAKSELCGSGE